MKTRVSPKYLVNDCRLSSPKDESWSLISKVTGLGPATLLNKRLQNRRFPVNFAKFLRWSFLQNTSRLVLFSFYAQILVMIISSSGFYFPLSTLYSLHKKRTFALRTSPANVTKSAGITFTEETFHGKFDFFVQWFQHIYIKFFKVSFRQKTTWFFAVSNPQTEFCKEIIFKQISATPLFQH